MTCHKGKGDIQEKQLQLEQLRLQEFRIKELKMYSKYSSNNKVRNMSFTLPLPPFQAELFKFKILTDEDKSQRESKEKHLISSGTILLKEIN